MLSPPKHLYHAVEVTNLNGVVEMLRRAQHDVLSLLIIRHPLFNTILPYRPF